MLTNQQMKNAYLAYIISRDSKAEECTPESLIRSYWDNEADKVISAYREGVDVLKDYRPVIHRDRIPIYPEADENQIVIDAGYIATSPHWSLVSFVPRES